MGQKDSSPTRRSGPGPAHTVGVFRAEIGPLEFFRAEIGPLEFSGRDRPTFVSRAKIGPMSWRAEIGPHLFFKAEAGPSIWAGPTL